jgi:quercetin dioxygenase-like cupin family protein
MVVYSFAPDKGRPIELFGSFGATWTGILHSTGLHVGSLSLAPYGMVGAHPAEDDQLLLVVQGSGTVGGTGSSSTTVGPGSAVFWRRGEVHETRAGPEGLDTIVIEGSGLEPAAGGSGDNR